MKTTFKLTALVVLVTGSLALSGKPGLQSKIDVLFSPNGGCTDRIVEEISSARQTVRVQAYSFTSAPIAKAIRAAHTRGVDCEVILDSSQETSKYSGADTLHNHGVQVLIDDAHAIAHNKIILVDGNTVITGSFNFSRAAEERNAENLLVISGYPELAKPGFPRWNAHDGMNSACFPCDSRVSGHFDRSTRWVTGENKRFAFNSTASSGSNSTGRRSRVMPVCLRFVNWMKRSA